MSYTEIHKGQFKVLAYGDEEVIKYVNEHNLTEKVNIEFKDNKIVNYDIYDKDLDILTLFRNQETQKHVLIKHIEHFNSDEEYIDIFNRVNKDTFEYVCKFYNGGTCKNEIFVENLEKINYEDYTTNQDKLEIESDESYLIYDALNEYKLNNKQLTGYDRSIINDIIEKIVKMQVNNKW